MVTKTITQQPKSVTEVDITVPWADLQPLWEQNTQKIAAEAELPGFRKGQVPAEMVDQRFGHQIQQEFLKQALPQFLMESLKETDVVPIDYPQYGAVTFQKGSDLQYKAQLTVRPTVNVGDYKSIKVTRPEIKQAAEEEINKVVDDLFNRWNARPSSAPKAENTATAGSVSFNGDNAAAATKPTEPASTSNVAEANAAVANDDFAKAIGAENLADLKTKIKNDIEAEAKYNAELDFEEAILKNIEKLTTVDLPEILIQDELNRMLVSLQRRVSEQGLLIDEYLKSQGKTMDGLKSEWRTNAEENVRMELGLAEVARRENVEISDEELQAEVDKVQDARMKQQLQSEEPRMQLRHALRQTKTLNLLKSLTQ